MVNFFSLEKLAFWNSANVLLFNMKRASRWKSKIVCLLINIYLCMFICAWYAGDRVPKISELASEKIRGREREREREKEREWDREAFEIEWDSLVIKWNVLLISIQQILFLFYTIKIKNSRSDIQSLHSTHSRNVLNLMFYSCFSCV